MRTTRLVVAALALVAWAAPASAQELVTVRGTLSWSQLGDGGVAFVPERATVRGLLEEVPITLSPSGTEGTYEGLAFEGWILDLQVELQRCVVPGCAAPGFRDPGDTFQFYLPEVEIPTGAGEVVLDGAPPGDYGLQSVSGNVAVAGGTIAGGFTTFMSLVSGGLARPPAMMHFTSAPLDVSDATHAAFAVRLGVGQVMFQDVYVQYAECPPPPLGQPGPFLYDVTAVAPIVLPDLTVVNPIDCSRGPLILELEPPPATARVGAATRLAATLKNNSADYLYDARLHWEVKGPVRPRGWLGSFDMSCTGTGHDAESDSSTVDCAVFGVAPGAKVRGLVEIGALAAGDIAVAVTATSSSAAPVTEDATLGAVAGGGADLQVFPPTFDYEHGFQYWLNDVPVSVLNAGPAAAQDVEIRFSGAGLPVEWWDLADTFASYRDLGYVGGDQPLPDCATEAGSGDFVCRVAVLDAWQQLFLLPRWRTQVAGAATLTVEISGLGDPELGNNSVTVPITVVETPLTDLSTTHALLTKHPSLGAPLEFEWRVHNAGPAQGTALAFWGGLGFLSYETVSSPGLADCFAFGNELACYFHDLPPGGTAVVRIQTRAPSGGDYYTSSQVAAGLFPDAFDPDFANNAFELITDVSGHIPTLRREVTSLSGAMRIPCLPGDGYFQLVAELRGNERLQTRQLDDGTVAGFLHSNLSYRSVSGGGVAFTDAGDLLSFELVRGQQRQSDRIHVSPNKAGEDRRYSETYTWLERRPDGSEGLTLTWRITLRYQQDELGRWFEVLDRSDFECRR